jgi:hypothetical protein
LSDSEPANGIVKNPSTAPMATASGPIEVCTPSLLT